MSDRFYKILYEQFPQYRDLFRELESVQTAHYKRRLERAENISPEAFVDEFKRILDEMTIWISSQNSFNAEISKTTSSEKMGAFSRFLSNSYRVKSASLLRGFISSVNQANVFGMSLFLRSEIELLAMSHYAATVFQKRDAINESSVLLMRVLWGNKADKKSAQKFNWEEFPALESEKVEIEKAVARFNSSCHGSGAKIQADLAFRSSDSKSVEAINVCTAIARFDRFEEEENGVKWIGEYYDELSEIVHPNGLSNHINLKEGEHFWKFDFYSNPGYLWKFLLNGSMIFHKTLEQITNFPPDDSEFAINTTVSPSST